MTIRAISTANRAKTAATTNAPEMPDVSTWSLQGAGSVPVLRNSSRWAGLARARKERT
jgi:hypothetical protein